MDWLDWVSYHGKVSWIDAACKRVSGFKPGFRVGFRALKLA